MPKKTCVALLLLTTSVWAQAVEPPKTPPKVDPGQATKTKAKPGEASPQATKPKLTAAEAEAKARFAKLSTKLRRFAVLPSIRKDEDKLTWWLRADKGRALAIVDVSKTGRLIVRSGTHALVASPRLLGGGPELTAAIEALPKLRKLVLEAEQPLTGSLLSYNPLTGALLRGQDYLAFGSKLLDRYAVPAPTKSKLDARYKELKGTLQKLELPPLVRRSFEEVLHAAITDAEGGTEEEGNPPASLVRRLVNEGWLRDQVPGNASVTAFEAAMQAATRLVPYAVYRGPGVELVAMSNEYDEGGWILRTPDALTYRHYPKTDWNLPPIEQVVELPAQRGVPRSLEGMRSTRVYLRGHELCSWSAEKGFVADTALWQKTVQGRRRNRALLEGYLPPHIPLVTLDGRVHGLLTPHGRIDPPANAADSKSFVAQAAKVLPDARHLDLLRVWLFAYVHDSPDNARPQLIGTPKVRGEIHQTVEQTLATVSGGRFRGDCDDLAELFQAITEKQGKLGHILDLPGHAAFGFAEKSKTGLWTTHVLHTGPPLAFKSRTLAKSLERTYRFFSQGQPFDPAQCPIAVRFSGENRRSNWVLGWRIFEEPAYSRTMIDVQRDWHFHTYRRGIAKMQRLVEDGDRDQANLFELAGLSERTHQHAKAAAWLDKALAGKTDPTGANTLRMLWNLYESEQKDKARKVAERFFARDLGRLRLVNSVAATQTGLQAVSTVLLSGKDWDYGAKVLARDIRPFMRRVLQVLSGYAQSNRFNKEQWTHRQMYKPIRDLARSYVGLVMTLVSKKELQGEEWKKRLAPFRQDAELWIRTVLPRDYDQDLERLYRWAMLGTWYANLELENLWARLDKAEYPSAVPKGPRRRQAWEAEVERDLRWVKASVPFWWGRLVSEFDDEKKSVDKEAVRRYAKNAEAALEATRKLGLDDFTFEHQVQLCRFVRALVDEDSEAIRKALREVKAVGDKKLREDTVFWIGGAARFMRAEWFTRVLDLFEEELDYKPLWFSIAWNAVENEAPARALQVAERAAKRFASDSAFAEERDYMIELFGDHKNSEKQQEAPQGSGKR